MKKLFIAAACIAAIVGTLPAQQILPFDSVSKKISYQFTIETDKSDKQDALYALTQDWFHDHVEQFTRTNTNDTTPLLTDKKKIENRDAVLNEFKNDFPLQSIDPASNRMTGKVITKYTGKNFGCIRLMYMEYFLVMEVQNHRINISINDIRYNHFNPKNFQPVRIYSYNVTSSCDYVNTLEYLKDCENCHEEFNGFYSYLNYDINELVVDLSNYIKANQSLPLKASTN